jgi:hypothetical protein
MHQQNMVWVWMIPLVVVGIGYVIAASRKGSVGSATLGSRRIELHTPMDPASAFQRISQAGGGRLKVDDADPQAKVLVLSSGITFGTWGFLYPVFIHAEAGGSRIEIGCHSKFIQLGPLVTRHHKLTVEEVAQQLGLPQARIA